MSESTASQNWWSSKPIPAGEGRQWRVGPMTLSVLCGHGELQVTTMASSTPQAAEATVESFRQLPDVFDRHERYAMKQPGRNVVCRPRLADRSVVAKPRTPIFVLPSQELQIFVSSPLWLEVQAEGQTLGDYPTSRMTDTWFGPSTREGDLAYSLKTQARTQIEQMPANSYRAITAVLISNEHTEPLEVDRMNLPVPYLGLYADAAGRFWTPSVQMKHRSSEDLTAMRVLSSPPAAAGTVKKVSEPRRRSESGLLVRAFSDLLQTLGGDS